MAETAFSKSLRILKVVTTSEGVRVGDLTGVVELPYGTARRLLGLLEEAGFVTENHGVFRAGPVLAAHIQDSATPSSLAEVIPAVLERLRAQTMETAACLVKSGTHAVVLAEAQSLHTRRVAHKRGQVMSLHAGAGPRTLLAFGDPLTLEQVLAHGLSRLTEGTFSERDLLRSLEQIRRAGYAVSYGEIIPHTVALAVPVSVNGHVVCSLAVTGPDVRCDKAWLSRSMRHLQDAVSTTRELVGR